ncbi:cob(I)alamin adenosyltransferase [Galdieria sulphuraria]|uniref:Corrinoid adenosyltransferase MMAB n=1 Tax=Galdieria sulphuraria TaxID=130081 RepID=M2X517_GALSU|nr:cob(I)alamin adenosyltransferase [Galdieria sulphuraria]EME31575.1 cob(I)alamin adenosyltransferase [Galdieria sulphuraria]|eukprot:XP_005708095.1 cob(I)alamin adenosyltransferase [Galdieria sulphuraria]
MLKNYRKPRQFVLPIVYKNAIMRQMFLFRTKQNLWYSLNLLNSLIENKEATRLFSYIFQQRNLHKSVAFGEKKAETKRIRIYTRTGDKGKSSLLTGERKPKDDAVFEVLGTIDELNAHVGLCVVYCRSVEKSVLTTKLEDVQSSLFDVGAAIASHSSSVEKTKGNLDLAKFRFDHGKVEEIEQWIDELEESLPPLRNFILPSGGLLGAQLHITRAVGRRTERRFWTAFQHTLPTIQDSKDQIEALQCVGQYLNRLGDLLFVAARIAAQETGNPEILYKRPS